MLRYELTPNNAGIILWGDSESLSQLHEFIHYIVNENPIVDSRDDFILSLAYDLRKTGEGHRHIEQFQHKSGDVIKIYGIELLWPLILFQLVMIRTSIGFAQVNKKQLSTMYSFEYVIETALQELYPQDWAKMLRTVRTASEHDFNLIEEAINNGCCYFIDLIPEQRKNQLQTILCSFDPLWCKNTQKKEDIKILESISISRPTWPESIDW